MWEFKSNLDADMTIGTRLLSQKIFCLCLSSASSASSAVNELIL
jgi:hypothetical protein